jgi:hypothetical protein
VPVVDDQMNIELWLNVTNRGNMTHSKSRQTQQLDISVLIQQHVSA